MLLFIPVGSEDLQQPSCRLTSVTPFVCPQIYMMSYKHLVKFLGISVEPTLLYIIREDFVFGSLHQVIHDPLKKLDDSFKVSFALDIARVGVYVRM